jgi:hypothetical protein
LLISSSSNSFLVFFFGFFLLDLSALSSLAGLYLVNEGKRRFEPRILSKFDMLLCGEMSRSYDPDFGVFGWEWIEDHGGGFLIYLVLIITLLGSVGVEAIWCLAMKPKFGNSLHVSYYSFSSRFISAALPAQRFAVAGLPFFYSRFKEISILRAMNSPVYLAACWVSIDRVFEWSVLVPRLTSPASSAAQASTTALSKSLIVRKNSPIIASERTALRMIRSKIVKLKRRLPKR